MKRYLALESN